MKYNQFSRIETTHQQQVSELIATNFLPKNYEKLAFSDLLAVLFGKLFPEAKSLEAKKNALAGIALNEEDNLYTFVDANQDDVLLVDFYNAALQVLGYHVGYDYELSNPIQLFKKQNLPYLSANKINQDNLIYAFYLLLLTRAKNGLCLIDNLAAKGYFKPWFNAAQPQFVFFNGKSLPVFDTSKIIKEVVYIESDLDTDQDGQRDLLQATVFRPFETNKNLKVPVLYTANPYFGGTNDIDSTLHNVDENLTEVAADFTNQKQATPTKFTKNVPNLENAPVEEEATRPGIYTLNEYLLARGFANVYAGGIGTYGSDGVRICGAPEETMCAKEIIEWLTGDRIAYTNRDKTHQTKAWWSNENVGMTGKSYLGTLSTAVATTGVKGLKTVISEAAISSWYDYYREHGLVIAPVLCQGEDTDILSELCQSNFQESSKYVLNKPFFDKNMAALKRGQDRITGQYNDFWAVRNYRPNVKNIKCSFISVHGLNDGNVKPKNVYKLWQELVKLPSKHKLFLHQGPHTYMNNLASIDFTDMMNLWLCQELLGVKNNALAQWPDVMIQDNLKPDTWQSEQTWSNELGKETTYHLTENNQLSQSQEGSTTKDFEDLGGKQYHEANIGELEWENEFLAGQEQWQKSQLRFVADAITKDTTLVGRPKVSLKVASSLAKGQLSVALIELDKRQRLSDVPGFLDLNGQPLGYNFGTDSLKEFVPGKTNSFKLIAKGHCNLQNSASLLRAQAIEPNEFYELNFELQPTYYHLPVGAKLGLVVYSTDMGMTKRPQEETTYQLDLAGATLTTYEK